MGGYNGSMQDVPDTFSLPVFMTQQAVNSMNTVKNLGEQQAKNDKICLILEILGILVRLPAVCFATALGVLDGVFETVSVAGDIALGIQSVIANPISALMLLLDISGGRNGNWFGLWNK